VIDAVFAYYRSICAKRRLALGHHADDLAPDAASADGLQAVMELRTVEVYPEEKDGRVAIGLYFVATWTAEWSGFGVVWRDDQVIRVTECSDRQLKAIALESARRS